MIYNNLFANLSEEARIWVYPIDKKLSSADAAKVEASLKQFIQNWHSHGRKVKADFAILFEQFILIGAEIPEAEISGCGIDASVHAVESIGGQSQFSILTGLAVFYRDGQGIIRHVSRSEFRKGVRKGEITGDTVVIDPSISFVSQLRAGSLELPAKSSWHATVFRIPSVTT